MRFEYVKTDIGPAQEFWYVTSQIADKRLPNVERGQFIYAHALDSSEYDQRVLVESFTSILQLPNTEQKFLGWYYIEV